MKPATLRTVLDRVLRLSLGPAAALGAGCGAGLPADPSAYELPVCAEGLPSLQGVKPGVIVDFAELRQIFSPGEGGTERTLSSFGAACATATNAAACGAQLAALKSTTGFFQKCVDACLAYYVATTRGDEVKAVNTPADWRAFLGAIDVGQEAVLAAWGQGYDVSCTDKTRGGVRPLPGPGGYEVIATKGIACGAGSDVTRYVLQIGADGTVREVSAEVIQRGDPNCAIGRRPAGLRTARGRRARTALGRHFAAAARLEAASVGAFRTLALELDAHGAPEALRAAAVMAALDEVRHARITARLARRFGGCPQPPRVAPRAARSLDEIALENCVEGCVRETFGALVALWQAGRATEPEVAAAMAEIAVDETRHAALGWQVGEWAAGRLGRGARASLRAARRRSVEGLRAELAAEPAAEIVALAGAPTSAEALALCEGMDAELWRRAG